jgi:gliding motility-associated-like protein
VQDNNCAGYAFSDSSVNAISFEWNFGHPISGSDNWSAERNPRHTYAPDTGLFSVCLLVSNSDGCRDSICKELISAYTVYAELYNVFTPGSDASNDVFLPKIEGSDKYKIQIYNRWGEMVFSSSNPLFGWDGTDQKSGAELPGGTYFYILEYRFECTGEEEKVYGAVELIRK